MSPEIVTALIVAVASLAVSVVSAVVSYRSQGRLALLEDELVEARAERDAQRDYVYDARKRLYAEFQPLLFQLVELSDGAYSRIVGLAHSARAGDLRPDGSGWLSEAGYYSFSTIHRLLAPLVLFRLAQRRLTLVDLSADPQVRFQYAMAKQLYATWTESWELTHSEPAIKYEPNHVNAAELARSQPQIYAWQHVITGRLDGAVDALTVREGSTGRCMTYGEFEEAVYEASGPVYERVEAFASLFIGFHPDTRPVLWRTLLAEAHIYKALIHALESDDPMPLAPAYALNDEDAALFDWRPHGSKVNRDAAVEQPLTAVRRFLEQRLPAPAQ